MLADPVFGDNGPQPQPQKAVDPRQQVMMAMMQQRMKQQPQGGGIGGGLNQAAQNMLQMYLMGQK